MDANQTTPDPGPRVVTDVHGRKWNLFVSVGTKRQLRAEIDVDLATLVEDKCSLFEKLATDDEFLVSFLYVVCSVQIEERGLSELQFADCWAGDALDRACPELMLAIVDFFRSARQREMLRNVIDKARAVAMKTTQLAAAKVQQALDAVDVDYEARTSIERLPAAPGSSPATPSPTVGDSSPPGPPST